MQGDESKAEMLAWRDGGLSMKESRNEKALTGEGCFYDEGGSQGGAGSYPYQHCWLLCYAGLLSRVTASTKEENGGPSTSRWAGPPASGSGPSLAGWIQSHHCYCASGLLKLAGQTRGGKQHEYRKTEVGGDRRKQRSGSHNRQGKQETEVRRKNSPNYSYSLFSSNNYITVFSF